MEVIQIFLQHKQLFDALEEVYDGEADQERLPLDPGKPRLTFGMVGLLLLLGTMLDRGETGRVPIGNHYESSARITPYEETCEVAAETQRS